MPGLIVVIDLLNIIQEEEREEVAQSTRETIHKNGPIKGPFGAHKSAVVNDERRGMLGFVMKLLIQKI